MRSGVFEYCAPVRRAMAPTIGFGHAVSNATDPVYQVPCRLKSDRVDELRRRHRLTEEEAARLRRVFTDWPAELVEQGLEEELADIKAARELAELKPLSVDDLREIAEIVNGRGHGW